jgi:hypothetical protein
LTAIPSIDRNLALLGRNLHDLVVFFVIPGAIALLPWYFARRALWRAASWDWLFGTDRARVAGNYAEWVGRPPRDGWVQRHRFHLLLDRVTPFRILFLSPSRIARRVDVTGDPVPAGPFVALGAHYGSGLWSFPKLRVHGVRIGPVSAALRREFLAGRPFRYWFARLALGQAARLCGLPMQYTDNRLLWTLRRLLRGGNAVAALLDVPAGSARHRQRVSLLGRDIDLPTGIVELARIESLPVVVWTTTVDERSGRFRLRTRTIAVDDTGRALDGIVAHFSQLLKEDSAAWHAWSWGSLVKQFAAAPTVVAEPRRAVG